MRYRTQVDEDRLTAGWGHWSWIVDATRSDPARFLRLLSSPEAKAEAARLNAAGVRCWFAWRPVYCDDGSMAFGRFVWARYEFIGGTTTKRASPPSPRDIHVWRYYRSKPPVTAPD